MAASSSGIAVNTAADGLRGMPFRTAAEHLLAELDCLKLLLHRQVLRLRAASLLREDQFRGLYISDEEVDAILNHAESHRPQAPTEHSSKGISMQELADRIDTATAALAVRLRASELAGVHLPLFRLARLFALSPFEQFALLLCVAPELDSHFETLFAYVQNDVTRKRPSPGLILSLFVSTRHDCLALRPFFSPTANLFRVPLVHFGSDPPEREGSVLGRPLRPEPRIVDYLLGQGEMDERLRPFVTIRNPKLSFNDLQLPGPLAAELQCLGASQAVGSGVIFLEGKKGSGRRSIAEAICREQGRLLLVAQWEQLPSEQLSSSLALKLLLREAQLQCANLFLAGLVPAGATEVPTQQKGNFLLDALDPGGFLIFVPSDSPVSLADALEKHVTLSFKIPPPDFAQRAFLWTKALSTMGCRIAAGVDTQILANKFQLTGGEIQSVCREAACRASLREAQEGITLEDLVTVARSQSNQGLRRLAAKVNSIHDWTDLVLPQRCIRQLREVCSAEKFRHIVYSQWGYDRRLALGKGLNALFCGPSGTGKTMAAGILSRELALDLYKIDLSSVVSKYIGETEKQLSQIFREAASSNAILFFDEADALFGKRSEVKDAHDRYANVEVAYLLQKMEEYEGIVILATNFRRNMDDAFTRRMHHIVEFPFPDADLRERIWKGLVPPGAPLADDVNFGFLARQFELSGGNIRNVALAAAFLAAESGGKICMEHFIHGAAREMQKLGKLPSRSEFREYYDLLRTPS